MEDKSIQEHDITELPVQGSGSILATERKKQNKTVEEIADLLNLSTHQIRTIELDQADGLPEPTYVRGYIRSYANLLGMDADDVLKNFLHPNWQQARRLDDMSWGVKNIDAPSGLSGGSNVIRIGVVSTFFVAAAIAWYFGLFDSLFSQQVNTTVTDTSVQQIEELQSETTQDTGSESESLNNEQSTENINLSIALEDIPDQESDLLADTAELVLNFTQTSWVDIRDETDARLAYKSYVAGEELVVSSTGSMSVFIGTAQAVSVKFNGEDFDIEPYREGVYAKFVVNDK